MNDQSVLSIIQKIAPGLYFIGGLVVKHLWDTFINKISKIHYYVKNSFLGSSTNNPLFGSVEILYNKIQVKNLYMSKIEVINSSRKDFSDVEIKIWCDMDSIILVSYGTKKGTVTPLDFTSEYKELESNISKEKKRKFFQTRCYFVPVLNRNDVLEFSCLTTNLKNNEPSLFIDCEHKGLKMENKLLPPLIFWNEPQHLCAIWGLIISGILIIPIFYFLESKIAIGIISFLLGSLLILPGAIFLKLIKKIRKIFY